MNTFSQKFFYRSAESKDDLSLRYLLNSNPMPGYISLIYRREPNYFYASSILGQHTQTVVGIESISKKIVAVAEKTTKTVFINNKISQILYLGGLRVDRQYRHLGIFSGGWKYFCENFFKGLNTPILFSVIEGNTIARQALINKISKKINLKIIDLGRLNTFVINLCSSKKPESKDYQITSCDSKTLPDVLKFINKIGSSKQLFPSYTIDDFKGKTNLLRGFSLNNLYVARKDGRIVGTMGKWDQSFFKQTAVFNYGHLLRFIKPFYNLIAILLKYQLLPLVNQNFKTFYLNLVAIENNNHSVFTALFNKIHNDSVNQKYNFALLGLHESDQLQKSASLYSHLKYGSRLYWVTPNHLTASISKLETNNLYSELATM